MSQRKELAYSRVIDKIKLPEQYHRGKKLMADDRQLVRELYATGLYSYRGLAKKFGVAYGVIQICINPEAKKQQAEAGKRYRETHAKKPFDSMELRRYKKDLIKKGIIKIGQSNGVI